MPQPRSTTLIFAICLALWGVIVVHTAMNTKGPEDFVVTVPQGKVQSFAREQLNRLQEQSFKDNRELCAVIFEDSEGELGTTPLVGGARAGCDINFFDEPGMAPVASIHTHGAFDRDYDDEVPSLLDMRSDIDGGMDGYISTPGGRFWRIDARARIARQICGEGCLAQDPEYDPCKAWPPADSYTLVEMQLRRNNDTGDC